MKRSQKFTTLQFNILYPVTEKASCARVTRFQIGYHKPLHGSSKYLQKKMKTKSWNYLSPIFSLYFHWGCRIISCEMSNLLRNSKNFSFLFIRFPPVRFFHWDFVEHIDIFRGVVRMGKWEWWSLPKQQIPRGGKINILNGIFHPGTGDEAPKGEWRHGYIFSLNSAQDDVGGQRHAPTALPPGIVVVVAVVVKGKGKGLSHNRPSRWPKGVRVG